jgi:IQ domain-containing protein H
LYPPVAKGDRRVRIPDASEKDNKIAAIISLTSSITN